jgi:hypothetical protein
LPAVTLNGEVGDVVTPAGNPEILTVTGSANPFCPAIDTENAEFESPALAVIVPGESAMLKSFAAGGEVGVDPPPQPARLPMHSQIHTVKNAWAGATERQHARIEGFPKLRESSIRMARRLTRQTYPVKTVSTTVKSR